MFDHVTSRDAMLNLKRISAVIHACVNEGQDKLPSIGYLSFTKDRTKLDLL